MTIEPRRESPNTGTSGEISWTLLDLDELAEAYWDTIGVDLRTEGRNPEIDRPTYSWLTENGYRTFVYALKEHHGLTFVEFWEDVLELDEPETTFEWGIEHDPTVESMEGFLDARADARDWSEKTIASQQYRLAAFARAYADENGTDDLLTPVQEDSGIQPRDATDACWDTFASLRDEYSGRTIQRIHRVTRQWYNYLETRHVAAFNPTDGIKDHYGWKSDNGRKNPPLAPEHVRALFDAAGTTKKELMVVALCAWGLRTGEVAALHRDQVVLEPEEDEVATGPYLQFDERKNGPGTVALVYGLDVLQTQLSLLSNRNEWNGYLFPSDRSSVGHIRRSTVNRWFDQLARTAGLPDEIDGESPVPQMARRFWYDAYSSTMNDILDHQIKEIAEEQGSADASTVLREYLTEDRRRELRRRFMREQLSEAFEADKAATGVDL